MAWGMEIQKMPHVHTPGARGKLLGQPAASLWAKAWRNTGANNPPTSPQIKKGKHGGLRQGLE